MPAIVEPARISSRLHKSDKLLPGGRRAFDAYINGESKNPSVIQFTGFKYPNPAPANRI
jgi:hypothetical protein